MMPDLPDLGTIVFYAAVAAMLAGGLGLLLVGLACLWVGGREER